MAGQDILQAELESVARQQNGESIVDQWDAYANEVLYGDWFNCGSWH